MRKQPSPDARREVAPASGGSSRSAPRLRPGTIRAVVNVVRALFFFSLLQTTSIYLHGSEHQVRKVIETVGLVRGAEGAADKREEKRSDQRAEFMQRRRATPAR